MTYVPIRNSIAAAATFAVGASQFAKAVRNLRRGGSAVHGSTGAPWLHIAALILSLSFMALGAIVLVGQWRPGAVDFSALMLAMAAIGIAGMALGAWMVKYGLWNGIVDRRLVTRTGVLDRTNSVTAGVLFVLVGFAFVLGGLVFLALAVWPVHQ